MPATLNLKDYLNLIFADVIALAVRIIQKYKFRSHKDRLVSAACGLSSVRIHVEADSIKPLGSSMPAYANLRRTSLPSQ